MDTSLGALVAWTSLIALLFLFWSWYLKWSKFRERVDKIPGPPGLPLLGNALELYVDHTEIFELITGALYCFMQHRIVRLWVGTIPYVAPFRQDTLEPILSSSHHIDKSYDYNWLHPWLGTGLLTSTGEKWKTRRKLLTPAFHFRILEDFVDVFNEQSEILVKSLTSEVGKDSFNIFPYITLCALDVICDTAMGRHVNAQGNKDSDYVKAIYRIGDIIFSRQTQPWLQFDWLFRLTPSGREHDRCVKILHDFTKQVIQERKVEWLKRSNSNLTNSEDALVVGKKRLAFLDLLLDVSDNGNVLSDEDIREEVDTFMFEGHDTTSAAISWTLYLLGCHPEIKKKVHDELDSVLGRESRPITSDDIKELKYLECVIKETLRLFPSVPMIARKLTKDVTIDNYVIPAGVTIIIITYMLHRDPEVFEDPEKFDPDRFLPENCQGRHPYAYIPFSAGPRNCIGQKFALMEEKIILAHILRAFDIESMESRENIKLLAELILRPQNGIIVKLKKRAETASN